MPASSISKAMVRSRDVDAAARRGVPRLGAVAAAVPAAPASRACGSSAASSRRRTRLPPAARERTRQGDQHAADRFLGSCAAAAAVHQHEIELRRCARRPAARRRCGGWRRGRCRARRGAAPGWRRRRAPGSAIRSPIRGRAPCLRRTAPAAPTAARRASSRLPPPAPRPARRASAAPSRRRPRCRTRRAAPGGPRREPAARSGRPGAVRIRRSRCAPRPYFSAADSTASRR